MLTALTKVNSPHHQATGFDQAKELDRTKLDRTKPDRACHSTLIHPLRLYPN
jgi:hypothetical protein